jgi:hypothetical protein
VIDWHEMRFGKCEAWLELADVVRQHSAVNGAISKRGGWVGFIREGHWIKRYEGGGSRILREAQATQSSSGKAIQHSKWSVSVVLEDACPASPRSNNDYLQQ